MSEVGGEEGLVSEGCRVEGGGVGWQQGRVRRVERLRVEEVVRGV